MVAGSTVVGGVAGGELRGGEGYGSEVSFGLRWFPIEAEALGSSARTRGSEWWRWMGGECLVATNGTGRQRRPNRPELGKMASSGQSTPRGELGGKT